MKNTVLFAIILFLGFNSDAQVSGSIGSSVDTFLSRTVPFGFSGACLVSKDGAILLNKGYGYANREKKLNNTIASVFSTGSLTKQFTAAAIMKLEMMGKIQTLDSLGTYFTGLPKDKENITIHHLLTHTSGLPLAFSEDDFVSISRDQYQKQSLHAKLQSEPGVNFEYSNVGYVLLAMIIEDVSGLPYEDFLQKYLFSPAGMTQTGYALPKWDPQNFVHIYNGSADNGTTLKMTAPTWHLIGNGGILSTTTDIYKWVTALSGESILSEEAKKKMFTPFKNSYAYGWDVLDNGNLRQHNGGSSLGNGAELRWFVGDGLFTILFTNSTVNGTMGFRAVRNELEALTMGDEIPLPPEMDIVQKDLTPYGGTYQMPSGDTFGIAVKDGVASLLVDSQELLDLLVDPENYTAGGINVQLNKKIDQAFSKAVKSGDYSGFDFMGSSGQLEKEIKNELLMEGLEKPYYKVLRTLPSEQSKEMRITQVALCSQDDFSGECLMLHIVTDNEKYAGLGVDFGFANPLSLNIFPIGGNAFQLYDLNTKMGTMIEIADQPDGEYTFIVGDRKVPGIKKIK